VPRAFEAKHHNNEDLPDTIEDRDHERRLRSEHVHDDQLSLYLAGKGLTNEEAIHVKNHLGACKTCLGRLGETDVISRKTRQHYLNATNKYAPW
jgi:hypothetical protein